jgi:hypothetical protein
MEAVRGRINAIYGRRATTPWSDKETGLLRSLVKQYGSSGQSDLDSDLKEVEEYYTSLYAESLKPPFADFRRRQIDTFLRNFRGEVDKAHQYALRKQAIRSSAANDGPSGWRIAIAQIYKGSITKVPTTWSTVDEGTKAEVKRMLKG